MLKKHMRLKCETHSNCYCSYETHFLNEIHMPSYDNFSILFSVCSLEAHSLEKVAFQLKCIPRLSSVSVYIFTERDHRKTDRIQSEIFRTIFNKSPLEDTSHVRSWLYFHIHIYRFSIMWIHLSYTNVSSWFHFLFALQTAYEFAHLLLFGAHIFTDDQPFV